MEAISRDHVITYMYGMGDRIVKAGDLPPMKAIRAKCIDCSGGSVSEVTKCVIPDCPLYPYRMGRNPFRQERVMSPEQRAAAIERLAKGRTRKSATIVSLQTAH